MYSTEQIKALRIELTKAMRAEDIVSTLEAPAQSVNNEPSLLHCAAREGILVERFLSQMISILFKEKNREHFYKIVNDETLGFNTLRSWWRFSSYFRDNDPRLTLTLLINTYKKSDSNSMTRIKWFNLIFGQAYREKNWSFILHWSYVATNEELQTVNNRLLYGVLIGLINEGFYDEASNILKQKMTSMNELDKLFFLVPSYRLGFIKTFPDFSNLMQQLHDSLPDRGKEWDWICNAYVDKIQIVKQNFLDIRINPHKTNELRKILLATLKQKKALSFHRMGDGAVYRWHLPEIALEYNGCLEEDNHAKEKAWWNHTIERSEGDRFSKLVHNALNNADILGLISPYRLIRDASPQPMPKSITGRALLAHVEALGTHLPIENKIITEDRCHTILYTREFLHTLIRHSDRLVIVGGLSATDMRLPKHKNTKFIPLTPEQNKGLPTHKNAKSIVNDFDEISNELEHVCQPGTLALISGGYIGKVLVDVAKNSGAVALDVGSLADLLAGFHTRSPADAI